MRPNPGHSERGKGRERLQICGDVEEKINKENNAGASLNEYGHVENVILVCIIFSGPVWIPSCV